MGTLFIVATPIGNLKDITLRAIETLEVVDYVVCEDTRVTGKLLSHLEISKPMKVLNDANEASKVYEFVADLKVGKNIALVSDAGTPLISDPGYKLVRDAAGAGIKVESIPGASSLTVALTMSGLPTDKFTFIGYLPKKDGKKMELLKSMRASRDLIKSTFIIFESPLRIKNTLKSIEGIFGNIDVAICRELTKLHEEVYRGKLSDVNMREKGEFVILF